MTDGSIDTDLLPAARWKKSSCSNQVNECVEVALIDADVLAPASWRKSSRSNNQVNCVEVTATEPATGIRDSKHPRGPALLFPSPAFARFLTYVQRTS